MIIQTIQTGIALDGGRRAIMSIAPDQPPGSLADLRDYLDQQGFKTTPGYDGGHLLRIRGFNDDAALKDALNQYSAQSKPVGDEELYDSKAPFIPLDRADQKHLPFKTYIRQYATGLVGVTSLVSGISFLAKDLLSMRGTPVGSVERAKTSISAAAATLFVSASTALTFLGFKAAHRPSVSELIQSIEPKFKDGLTTTSLPERSTAKRALDYAKNNPWLVSTIFNALGTTIKMTGHAIPSTRTTRNPFTFKVRTACETDNIELAASISSFASLGLLATATPKQSPYLLGISSFENAKTKDPLENRYGKTASKKQDDGEGDKGHANMKIAGLLGMASNIGFGAKGALDVYAGRCNKDEIGKRALKSWPLLLVVPFNLAADYLTTISKPRFVYSTDELATETAAYIARQLDSKTATPEQVTREIFLLSEILSEHPRVNGNSHQLREAIAGRLHLDHGYEMLSNMEGIQEYHHLWEVSPFTRPAPQAPAHAQTGTSVKVEKPAMHETANFADRLQSERNQPLSTARLI